MRPSLDARRRFPLVVIIVAALAILCTAPSNAQPIEAIEHGLEIRLPGQAAGETIDLAEALRTLHIPSVDVAVIDNGHVVWFRTFGGAPTNAIYQAASLSKLVTAVAALRLVDRGVLDLDRNVNDDLTAWRVPENEWTRTRPVTLRGLLSMTAAIGVPGYLGYEPGAPVPTLRQILDGAPPANSEPVRVEALPGSRYAYSGGGYEIVQALIEAATKMRFQDALEQLVLKPAAMPNSTFLQPLPVEFARRAATGHDASGKELPGGWRIIPELAAGGLWSSATDLAHLLLALERSYRGEPDALLVRATAHAMMTQQNGGPYGLGGAVDGLGQNRALMKRGQNIGYQSYTFLFPATGQGIVVLTGSDNGTTLATALVRRAADAYRWPHLGPLRD
jgi:CubicO group peptidase (beta-lactamase class C family)